jgi:hypothetical protein
VGAVRDRGELSSFCCGSFRPLFNGNKVIGWGGAPDGAADFTETTSFGARLFALSFTDPQAIIYRVTPVFPDAISRDALRAGMDTQYGS